MIAPLLIDSDDSDPMIEDEYLPVITAVSHLNQVAVETRAPAMVSVPVVPLSSVTIHFTSFFLQLQPPVAQTQQPIVQPKPPVAQPRQPVVQPKPPVAQPRQPVVQPKPPVAQSQQPVAPSRAPPPTVPKPNSVAPPPSSTSPPLTEKEMVKAVLKERYAQYLEVCVCVCACTCVCLSVVYVRTSVFKHPYRLFLQVSNKDKAAGNEAGYKKNRVMAARFLKVIKGFEDGAPVDLSQMPPPPRGYTSSHSLDATMVTHTHACLQA